MLGVASGWHLDSLVATLTALNQDTENVFHITGSRYFGGAKPNSDWDFFVQDSPGLEAKLTKMGFTHIGSQYQGDPSVTKIYRTGSKQVGTQVDIQVVKDVWEKLAAQKIIKDTFGADLQYLRPGTKTEAWAHANSLVNLAGI